MDKTPSHILSHCEYFTKLTAEIFGQEKLTYGLMLILFKDVIRYRDKVGLQEKETF